MTSVLQFYDFSNNCSGSPGAGYSQSKSVADSGWGVMYNLMHDTPNKKVKFLLKVTYLVMNYYSLFSIIYRITDIVI